jgi:hypothetical protein
MTFSEFKPTFRHVPITSHVFFVATPTESQSLESETLLILTMYRYFLHIHPSGTELALSSSQNTTNPKGAMSMSTNKRKVIRTTLGDLIAAVTDEVKPFVRDQSGLYMVVSHIINDVLARHRLPAAHRATSH